MPVSRQPRPDGASAPNQSGAQGGPSGCGQRPIVKKPTSQCPKRSTVFAMNEKAEASFLEVGAQRLAYRKRDGASPTLIFFPGYASDMEGAKAVALDDFARSRGLAMVRFDYSGTGS